MILVTGPTGNVGSEVVQRLVGAGRRVRVLARDPAKAARLLPSGIEIVQGDLLAPETLDAALAGVESAFLLAGAMALSSVTHDFAAAAARAGVKHVVLNSSYTIELSSPNRLGAWHLAAEDELKAAGVAWTMLRPGNFATNTLGWVGMIRSQGAVFSPGADGRSAPIDPRDIGAVAAYVLLNPGHESRTYTLTGPEEMSVRDQVAHISRAIGKEIRVVEVPEAGARAGMLQNGMPEILADAILELIRVEHSETGSAIKTTVRDVTGEAARTFADWARDHAAAFQ